MHMKTLYISDLDGTLLQQDMELSNHTITTLNNLIEQGMLFSIATARTIASVRSILKDVTINLPIILMNGVCIYDLAKEEYINIETLHDDSKRQLISIVKDNNLKGFAYAIHNGVLSTYYENLNTEPLREFYEERVNKYKKPFIQVDDFTSLISEPLIYFCLMDKKENLSEICNLLENLPDLNFVFYKDNYTVDTWYLEIFSKYASKYHALQFIRNYLNIDSIVCFGDNRNDMPLFLGSDYKCAVANAVVELKEKADVIIGSNIEEGVVTWLQSNFLQ